jgi:uncharacterized protein YjeT (DUF2065 family)
MNYQDWVIALGYTAFVLFLILLGIGLILNPKRYRRLVSPRWVSVQNGEDDSTWTPHEEAHWRKTGWMFAVVGLGMVLLSLVAIHNSGRAVSPKKIDTGSALGWGSLLACTLSVTVGLSLIIAPMKTVQLFSPTINLPESGHKNSVLVIRGLGIVIILISTFILVHH